MEIIYTYKKRHGLSMRVIDETTLEVTHGDIPQHEIDAFIKKHKRWIQNRMASMKTKNEYKNSNAFYYLGKPYEVVYEEGTINEVKFVGDKLIVYHTSRIKPETVFNHYINTELKHIYTEHFNQYVSIMGVKRPTLKIKKMKSKWGYCKWKENVICLDTTLLQTPLYLLDYVIVHELCHLTVHNHQKEFHDLVEYYYKDHRKAEKELKEYGILLK